jgi:hypothetical protein
MASGHVNRANRPNTWLLRPTLRREDSSCQPGAVHTWPIVLKKSKVPPQQNSRKRQLITEFAWQCPFRLRRKAAC